jgi:hypothetical protein
MLQFRWIIINKDKPVYRKNTNTEKTKKGKIKSNTVEKVLTEYVDGWLCQDLFFYYFIDNS